jgi:hypothetical protein
MLWPTYASCETKLVLVDFSVTVVSLIKMFNELFIYTLVIFMTIPIGVYVAHFIISGYLECNLMIS